MYSRFLKEAYNIIGDNALLEASKEIEQSGILFTKIANLFKSVFTIENVNKQIVKASDIFKEIAELENKAFTILSNFYCK